VGGRFTRRRRPRFHPGCVDVAHRAALRRLAADDAVAAHRTGEIQPPRERGDGFIDAGPAGTSLHLNPVDKAFALELVEQREAEAARTSLKVVRIRALHRDSHRGLECSQGLCGVDTAETRHVEVEKRSRGGVAGPLARPRRRPPPRGSTRSRSHHGAVRRSGPVRLCHRRRRAPGLASQAPTTRCLTVRSASICPRLDCESHQPARRRSGHLWG
jgi:hypothetical protein